MESVLPSFHLWYRAYPSLDTIYVYIRQHRFKSNFLICIAYKKKTNNQSRITNQLDKCAFTIDGRALIFKLLGVDLMAPLGLLFCIVRVMGLISTA